MITQSDTEKTRRVAEKCFLGVPPCSSADLREISGKRRGVVPQDHTTVVAILAFSFLLIPLSRSQAQNIFRMSAQERAAYFAEVNKESYQDWTKMIARLNIDLPKSLPPPAEDLNRPKETFQKTGSSNWYDSSGNTYTRSAWGTWNNYDEAKANPYQDLPDPLMMNDGKSVKNALMWWKARRPQIVMDFNNQIYGWVPRHTPAVRWEVVGKRDTTIGTIPAVTSELVGHVDNSIDPKIDVNIKLAITLPARAAHPVPVILEFGFNLPPGFHFPGMTEEKGPTWQEQVLGKGWGCAVYDPTSVQADNGAGLKEGIIGLMNKGGSRNPDQWGALRAWAWGASRILDYFETDKSINAKKVGIEGVSRYGKAVLVTMAYDPRFAIVCVGSSGKGGAALFRRDFGEDMGNICSSGEYHWFAGNLLKYVLHPDRLSVDSHELIALCAPRPVFISEGSPEKEGNWVDDRGQFMAEAAAQPVYRLLGDKGLGTDVMPPIGTALLSGALAFRQHHDGHEVGPNWPYFLSFAGKFFNAGTKPVSR